MQLYSNNENYKLYQGNMLDMLEILKPNCIDGIVTDPPYELNFMSKGWDNAGVSFKKETWQKCLEVLKPGGYLLAFGGSRTFHRIACAIEDAGFEIRDTIMWLYGSGFPKSQNIGKMYDKKMGNEREKVGETKIGKTSLGDGSGWNTSQNMKDLKATGKVDITKGNSKWEGWGSCLKPSFEPIIVARKPFKGSLVDNVIEWGVGGINIDECRVPAKQGEYDIRHYTNEDCFQNLKPKESKFSVKAQPEGRFPANTILTYEQITFDEVCGGFPNTKKNGSIKNPNLKNSLGNNGIYNKYSEKQPLWEAYSDSGSAARYFYCAKASKKDRDEGLDCFEQEKVNDGRQALVDNPFQRGETLRKNIHPTVKPTELMQYLIRLVTPNGGVVLDPFNGSGSTGKAVMYENKERAKGYKYIGIELDKEYLEISKARIDYVIRKI